MLKYNINTQVFFTSHLHMVINMVMFCARQLYEVGFELGTHL